jgi:hypothetical protein
VGGGGATLAARKRLEDGVIPWAAILKHGPAILGAANALLVRASASSTTKAQGIEARLASLEQGSRESAQLLQDIAQQIQALALAQDAAARRARIALIIAAGAGFVAIGAWIFVFVW